MNQSQYVTPLNNTICHFNAHGIYDLDSWLSLALNFFYKMWRIVSKTFFLVYKLLIIHTLHWIENVFDVLLALEITNHYGLSLFVNDE